MQPQPIQPSGGGTLSVGDAIGYGWNAFKKYPGPLILIAVVVLVLSGVFSGIASSVDSFAVAMAFRVFGWLLGILLSLGLLRVALKVTRGEEPEVADLFVFDNFGPYLGASVLYTIALYIGLALCIVPGVFVAIILGFFGFAIVDRNAGVGDSFSTSSEITKGQRGAVFLLLLAIVGINIVGALLCLVGLFVSYPVSIIAFAYAYRVLSNEPVAPIAA